MGDTDDQLLDHLAASEPSTVPAGRVPRRRFSARRAATGRAAAGWTDPGRAAGFKINSLVVLPEAQHRVVEADDTERTLIIEQLRAARQRVFSEGITDERSFDADLEELEREDPFEEFRLNAKIIVLAERPAS